jgi:hypothetical protein
VVAGMLGSTSKAALNGPERSRVAGSCDAPVTRADINSDRCEASPNCGRREGRRMAWFRTEAERNDMRSAWVQDRLSGRASFVQ